MITLGGITNTELGFKVLRDGTDIPGMPDTRDRLMSISGRHGDYDFGADLGPRLFMLNCYFDDDEAPEDIQASLRSLSAHLLDNWGRPKTLELVFDFEPDKSYLVRYSGSHDLDTEAATARRWFMLPLIAPDPHAFGPEVEEEAQLTASPQIETFEIESGLNVPLTIILDNEGENTINGFSFKTFDLIEEWSVHD